MSFDFFTDMFDVQNLNDVAHNSTELLFLSVHRTFQNFILYA